MKTLFAITCGGCVLLAVALGEFKWTMIPAAIVSWLFLVGLDWIVSRTIPKLYGHSTADSTDGSASENQT
jgi:hypothetical protein